MNLFSIISQNGQKYHYFPILFFQYFLSIFYRILNLKISIIFSNWKSLFSGVFAIPLVVDNFSNMAKITWYFWYFSTKKLCKVVDNLDNHPFFTFFDRLSTVFFFLPLHNYFIKFYYFLYF